uniref:SGNH hydrolase-type esterase domain-containing protein n=1 Tax=Salarias fasciatus TaxID=181472 RepID=A0A672FPL3_SALFA
MTTKQTLKANKDAALKRRKSKVKTDLLKSVRRSLLKGVSSEKELPAAVPEKDVPTAAREPGRSPPVPERRRSPRTAASAARLRLIREAVRRHSVSHHRGENQNQGQDHRSGSEVAAGGVTVPAERSPALGADTAAPDTHDVAPQPPPPRPLFSPTTLLVGDSSIRNIRFFNAITRCIPGATVPTILHGLPELLQSLPSTVRRVIVHVGTNDTARRQSEVTKQDFKDLFNLLESCGRSVFISGPLPTFFRGAERFSRLLGLNTWLQRSCTASNFYFIDNFNLFWNRPAFYHQDGLHPSTLGSSILAGNIQHTVHTSPTD